VTDLPEPAAAEAPVAEPSPASVTAAPVADGAVSGLPGAPPSAALPEATPLPEALVSAVPDSHTALDGEAPDVAGNIILDVAQPPAATSDMMLASDFQALQAWVQKDVKPTAVVVPPSEVKPSGPVRPIKKLKSSCLDVTDMDNGQDCLDLSAMGTPRKTVAMLRKKKVEVSAKKKATKLKDGEVEVDVYEIRLSERAIKELALLELLPSREFTIDESGRIEMDESAHDAHCARLQSDLPGS